MTTIYLASTYSDLQECREAVGSALQLMGYTLASSEIADPYSLAECLRAVAACDLYLGLFAWCYGPLPLEHNLEQRSIPDLAYREALRLGKPCLLFLLAEQSSWSPPMRDSDSGEGRQGLAIKQLREELVQPFNPAPVHFFKDPDHLVCQVGQALLNWEEQYVGLERTLQTSIAQLPHWWHYTLLRCHLNRRADAYPPDAFAALIQQQRAEDALALAASLTQTERQVQVLLMVARHWCQQAERAEQCHHLLTKAHVLARSIPDSAVRNATLVSVCEGFASLEQWERAEAILRIIKDSQAIVLGAGKLMSAYLRTGQRKHAAAARATALEEAQSIELPRARAEAFCAVGIELAQVLEGEQARVIWQEAEKAAWSIVNTEEQDFAEEQAAILYKIDEARYLLVLALANARSQDWQPIAESIIWAIRNGLLKTRSCLTLFSLLCEEGQEKAAEKIWYLFEQALKAIEQDELRAEALREAAVQLVKAGQKERAALLWPRVERIIQALPADRCRSQALWELGVALAAAQRWNEAEAHWLQVEQVDPSFAEGWANAEALRKLANVLVQDHRWKQARITALSIKNSRVRNQALSDLATAFSQVQQWEMTGDLIQLIEDLALRASCLQQLGIAQAQAQLWPQAEALWTEAAAAMHIVAESPVRTASLCWLGLALARANRFTDAQRVWQEAEQMARLIPGYATRTGALRELGVVLVSLGDHTTPVAYSKQEYEQQLAWANRIWNEAETAACMVKPDWLGATMLRDLSIVLAQAQQWDRAEAVAHLIDSIWAGRAEALRELALQLLQAHEWKRAIDVVYTIKEQRIRATILQKMGAIFITAQQWVLVDAVIGMTSEKPIRASILAHLARARSSAESQEATWLEAERIARSIESNHNKAQALGELGREMMAANLSERAAELCSEAHMVARTIETDWLKMQALKQLGNTFSSIQHQEQALSLWYEAAEVARMLKFERDQATALAEIAACLFRADKQVEATLLWGEAEALIGTISEGMVRADTLRLVVRTLVVGQQRDYAEKLARSMEEVWASRDETFRYLATCFMHVQQWERAESLALAIREPRIKVEVMSDLASQFSQAQLHMRAVLLWSQTEEVAYTIQPDTLKVQALLKLGSALAEAGQRKHALSIWQEAEIVAYTLEEQGEQAHMLIALAQTLSTAEAYEQLIHVVQRSWLAAASSIAAIQLLPLLDSLIQLNPAIGISCFETFTCSDIISKGRIP